MAELGLPEQEPPSLTTNEELAAPESDSNLIKVTIDEDDDNAEPMDTSVVENSHSTEKTGNQALHDHDYGNCTVQINTGVSFYGQNGEAFPLLEGLGDYVDSSQSKISLPSKPTINDSHNPSVRAIRTSAGPGLSAMTYVDPKSKEEMLKRRSGGNILNRANNDVYVLSGRAFDSNRVIEQKKLQPGSFVNKFPLRSAIKPAGSQQGIALTRQFNSPNTISSPGDQINPNIAIYQQRQQHRGQQPIILKATPRILQPVPSAYGHRRQPMQRQNVQQPPPRKQVTDEETALLDVVNEEEMRNQKFFQKQIGNQMQQQNQHQTLQNLPNQQQQAQRQVTTSVSTVQAPEDNTDPHGYFHKFQGVRHQPTNLIQSPTRQDFSRTGYAAPPKPFYQSPQQQQQQQFGRLSQPGSGQPSHFMPPDHHQAFPGNQAPTFQSQSPVRPRVRKPLIETTESPQRTPKAFTSPVLAPKSAGRGRKKKDSDVVVSEKKISKKKVSHNENDEYGDVEGVDYVTRCICEMKNNDPNMIACDRCNVWQHMVCMGITPGSKSLNADYLCEKCNPRPLKNTREQAVIIQRAFLAAAKEKNKNRKSTGKTIKSVKELNKSQTSEKEKSNQRRSSLSAGNATSKPESKFIETKITRGIRKILDKLDDGDNQLAEKLGEPQVQTLVVAPNVYGVVSKADIPTGEPIFEYKASMSLRDERGSQSLSSKFFGNLIHFVPGKSDDGGELIYADASRHSDIFSSKVRKSCQPNTEIRHLISKDRDNEEILRLFVVAREPIEQCTEITVPLDLEYRSNEISELDCVCRLADYPNQTGTYSDDCSVAKYIQKKEHEFTSPPKQTPPKPASPKQATSRRRTISAQQPQQSAASSAPKKEEPEPEVSPLSTKTPTPLPMELEIANILIKDLTRSNSTAGTAKSLTSSPARRSPVKSNNVVTSSSKKSSEKAKKTPAKVKKEPASEGRKKSTRRSEGMSREIASLFDDNKFMASTLEGDETTTGRSLRHRAPVKKEDPETPSTSSKPVTPAKTSSSRKRGHSPTMATPASTSKTPKKTRNADSKSSLSADQLYKTFNKTASNFKLPEKIRILAKKSKRSALRT